MLCEDVSSIAAPPDDETSLVTGDSVGPVPPARVDGIITL